MSDGNEIKIGALIAVIKQSLVKILAISSLLAFMTLIILSQLAPRFLSESRVLVSPIASYQNPAAGRNPEASQNIDEATILSQIQVIQSRDIIAKVVDNFGLLDDEKFQTKVANSSTSFISSLLPIFSSGNYESFDPSIKRELTIDYITNDMQVVSLSQSRVIGIRYHSSDRVRAAGIANSLAAEYINWQRSEKVNQHQDDSIRLSRLIGDLKKEVKQSEAAVAQYRAKKGIFKSSRSNVTLSQQQLTELNSRIITARERSAESEIRAKLIREMLQRDGEVTSAPDTMRSQLIQRLFEQKTRVKRTASELSATLLPSHPRLKQLSSELKGINQQIRAEMYRIVQSAENDSKIAQAREQSLQKSLDDLKNLSTRSDGDEIQLRALQREARTNRDLLNTYLARFRDAEARKDSAIAPAYASIISKAHIPTNPYFPKKFPLMMLVFIASMIVGTSYVILLAVIGSEQTKNNNTNEGKENQAATA